jgi:hypothetical protein
MIRGNRTKQHIEISANCIIQSSLPIPPYQTIVPIGLGNKRVTMKHKKELKAIWNTANPIPPICYLLFSVPFVCSGNLWRGSLRTIAHKIVRLYWKSQMKVIVFLGPQLLACSERQTLATHSRAQRGSVARKQVFQTLKCPPQLCQMDLGAYQSD